MVFLTANAFRFSQSTRLKDVESVTYLDEVQKILEANENICLMMKRSNNDFLPLSLQHRKETYPQPI